MGFTAGASIGPYRVVGLLGSGGMGEVYRAHDPRLGRDVAIKVLRSDARLGGGRLQRFEQEARTASALSHPNVVAVYDFGSHDAVPYVVTELLEGEPLDARIRSGDLTPLKAVAYAIQIAQGLAAVHDKGIVHGDLKPGNIFVTHDGRLKLLDFGLSRVVGADPADESDASTGALHPVQGTLAYLSPEQVQGQAPDHRSDLFAFGVVLYEMLSGRRAFPGREQAAVLNAILSQDPPSLSGSIVAPPLGRILERCLEKRPAERFQSAHDVALALRAVADLAVVGPEATPGQTRMRSWLVAAGVAALALAAAGSYALRGRPGAWRLASEAVPLSSEASLEFHPSLAPDGGRVAFVADAEPGNFDIYVKQVGADSRLRLTSDPAFDCCPKWTPDGHWVAFIRIRGASGTILMVPALGGAERRLMDLRVWFGSALSFAPDGKLLAYSDGPAPGPLAGLFVLALDSLQTRRVTVPAADSAGDAFPVFSRDGRALAFARLPALADSLSHLDVAVVPAEGGEVRVLSREPATVGGVDWSPDDREVVFESERGGPSRLWAVPRQGGVPRLLGESPPLGGFGAEVLTEVNRSPRFDVGRDGQIAYTKSTYDTDLWRLPLVREGERAETLAASTRLDEAPQYAPDGRRIAFVSSRDTRRGQIWVCDDAGASCVRVTTNPKEASGTPRWSPDGRTLAFDSVEDAQTDLFTVDVETRAVRRVTGPPHAEAAPSWSRDGRSLYFASDRGDGYQVWRMPVEGGPARQITRGGGFAAFESPDGQYVYYSRIDQPGLWRIPTAGGTEERVLDLPQCWGYWALAPQGIYFLDSDARPAPEIRLQRNGATQSEHVAWLRGGPACGESGLTAAPDGSALVYVQADRKSDIVLLDVQH